jgi:hypothetical protein
MWTRFDGGGGFWGRDIGYLDKKNQELQTNY